MKVCVVGNLGHDFQSSIIENTNIEKASFISSCQEINWSMDEFDMYVFIALPFLNSVERHGVDFFYAKEISRKLHSLFVERGKKNRPIVVIRSLFPKDSTSRLFSAIAGFAHVVFNPLSLPNIFAKVNYDDVFDHEKLKKIFGDDIILKYSIDVVEVASNYKLASNVIKKSFTQEMLLTYSNVETNDVLEIMDDGVSSLDSLEQVAVRNLFFEKNANKFLKIMKQAMESNKLLFSFIKRQIQSKFSPSNNIIVVGILEKNGNENAMALQVVEFMKSINITVKIYDPLSNKYSSRPTNLSGFDGVVILEQHDIDFWRQNFDMAKVLLIRLNKT